MADRIAFQFHNGTIKTQVRVDNHDILANNFNSIMVQLKREIPVTNLESFSHFNSIMVQLKQQGRQICGIRQSISIP